MSALAGIVRPEGAVVDQTDMPRMIQALTLYGKDAQRLWQQQNVAMAHLLFRTTPEDDYDQQPLLSQAITLTFAGRIDNREELIKALAIPVQEAKQMADSAIVLAAFTQWGAASFARLVGEFALAIWDANAKRLLLCRDLSGGRPLYWHRQNNFFAYASMPKGLFALGRIPIQINEERLADFLVNLPLTGAQSLYQHIQRVEPGHYLVLEQGQVRDVCFHRYDPERRIELPSDDDYVEAFKEKFEEAVRCRLRSRGGIGSQLSSGFDSSTVTAMAAKLLGEQQLTAFTARPSADFTGEIPKGAHADEFPLAALLAARHANINHVAVRAKGGLLDELSSIIHYADRPFRNMANLGWWQALLDDASARGIRVMLTGQQGNMGLSWDGSALLPNLLARGEVHGWVQEAIATRHVAGWSWKRIVFNSIEPFLPDAMWQVIDQWRGQPYSFARYSAIHPQFAQQMAIWQRAQLAGHDLNFRGFSDSRAVRCNVLHSMAEVGDNRMATLAKTGIELRDPTADLRFLEFCLAIPEAQFMRKGQNRFLLKRAYGQMLPQAILECKTKGFQGADWKAQVIASQAEIRTVLARCVASPLASRAIDLEGLNRLIEAYVTNQKSSLFNRTKLLQGISAGQFILHVENQNHQSL
ncbi:MAG: asparagine synthase-related protein [Gallionella sp.]